MRDDQSFATSPATAGEGAAAGVQGSTALATLLRRLDRRAGRLRSSEVSQSERRLVMDNGKLMSWVTGEIRQGEVEMVLELTIAGRDAAAALKRG